MPTIFEKIDKRLKKIENITKDKVREEVKDEILHERIGERYRGLPLAEKIKICLKILLP